MHAPQATAKSLSDIPQLVFSSTLCALCSRHVPFMYTLRFFAPRSTICALRATCAVRTAHSRIALAAAAPPCSIQVLSRFALVLPLRACPGRLRRHNCARRLPLLVLIAPMSVCTNLGLDQSCRLGANAGYVVLRGRLRAQCAHKCALVIADSRKLCRFPNESLYQFGVRSVQPFGSQRWICSVARTFARAARA
jgi:hypothetical protein